MRISPSPVSRSWTNKPPVEVAPACRMGNVLASAKFLSTRVTSSIHAVAGLDDAISGDQMLDVAGLLSAQCWAAGTRRGHRSFIPWNKSPKRSPPQHRQGQPLMDQL